MKHTSLGMVALLASLLVKPVLAQTVYRGDPQFAPELGQEADYWNRADIFKRYNLDSVVTTSSVVAADNPPISDRLRGIWASHPFSKDYEVDQGYEFVPMAVVRNADGLHFHYRRMNPRQPNVAVPGPWLRPDRAWRCDQLGPRTVCEFAAVDTSNRPIGFYQAELWQISAAEVFLGGIQVGRLDYEDTRQDHDTAIRGVIVLPIGQTRLRQIVSGPDDIFAALGAFTGYRRSGNAACYSNRPAECRTEMRHDPYPEIPYGYNPGLLLTSGDPRHAGILDAQLSEIRRVLKIVLTPPPNNADDQKLAAFYGVKSRALSNLFPTHPILGPLLGQVRDRYWAVSAHYARIVNIRIGQPGLFDWGSAGADLANNSYQYFFQGRVPSIISLGSAAMTAYRTLTSNFEIKSILTQSNYLLEFTVPLIWNLQRVEAMYATRLPEVLFNPEIWQPVIAEDAATPPGLYAR